MSLAFYIILTIVASGFLRNDKLKSTDGALYHRVVRLIGRDALKLSARPRKDGGQNIVMPADPTVYFIAHANNDGQDKKLDTHSRPSVADLYKRADNDTYDDDHEQEARAASRMQPALRAHILNRERQTLFVAENGLMLSTVICKQALHILHFGAQNEVSKEDY